MQPIGSLKAKQGASIYLYSIVLLLLLQVLASFVILSLAPDENSSRYLTLALASTILFESGFIALYFLYTKKRKVTPSIGLGRPKKIFWGFAALTPLFCIIFFYPISVAFMRILYLVGYVSPASPFVWGNTTQKILLILGPFLRAPVAEELIFRSALLSGVKQRFSNLPAAVLCGAAFSLMHMNPDQTMYQFFLGFALSYLALCSGSVLPAILGHALNNLIGVFQSIALADGGGFLQQPIKLLFHDSFFALENLLENIFLLVLLSIIFTAGGIYLIIKLCEKFKADQITQSTTETIVQTEQQIIADGKAFRALYLAGILICAGMWLAAFLTAVLG